MIIRNWITAFEELFPPFLAEQWDNVGLQIGNTESQITGILLTLDVTEDVLEEAIKHHVNLIVAHHPLLFRPLTSVDTNTYLGRMIETIIKNDITVYAAHTNLDISEGGLNTILAEMLQLENHKPLSLTTESMGLGRIGTLPQPTSLDELIETVKDTLNINSVRQIGDNTNRVESVALCGGSGSSLIDDALKQKADVYISGDITYHHALDAKNLGLTILDVGHNIEKEVLPYIKKMVSPFDETIKIYVSAVNTNPYIIK